MRPLLKKGGPAELLPLNLNDLVQNVLALISNDALLHRVSIEAVPAPALPVVYGDGVQIQQVILNLLVNAITAAATGPPAEPQGHRVDRRRGHLRGSERPRFRQRHLRG